MGSTTSRPSDADASTRRSGSSRWSAAWGLVLRHRKRLARVLGVLIVVLAYSQLAPAVPQESDLEFALGPDHQQVVELRVAYVQNGEPYKGARFDFPTGAPAQVSHRVSLPGGDYEVRVELLRRGRAVERIVRSMHSPAEGRLRLHLAERGR